MNINQARIAEIENLSPGAHDSLEAGICIMEAVAYVAGEPWSDAPQCACPVIAKFCMAWNDSLFDPDRTRILKPLIPFIVGTRSTPEVEVRRGYLVLDWLVRVFTPQWFDLVQSLQNHAKTLREIDPIVCITGAAAAIVKIDAARAAAVDVAVDAVMGAARAAAVGAVVGAARAAAADAAVDAVVDAAAAAARAAALDAAEAAALDAALGAAVDAAVDAAGAAVRAAALDAAWAAAGAALRPTTEWLQASAVELLHRMIEVKA